MDGSADKVAALADVIRALDTIGAQHAVGGGVAVGIRSGVPRATLDTGVAVRSSVDRNAIVGALAGAGLVLTGTFPHSLNFRHRSGEPVQIVIDPEFDPMTDPRQRPSKALGDRTDIALLRGDVPDPDEGW